MYDTAAADLQREKFKNGMSPRLRHPALGRHIGVGTKPLAQRTAHKYAWAIRSRLEPVTKVARMIQRHLDGVLRFVQHSITNGVAEGPNSKIMSIERKAGGFRNPQNFTTAIYFHCGGATSTLHVRQTAVLKARTRLDSRISIELSRGCVWRAGGVLT